VSVARFVADQRTMHRVPHTLTCAILGISISWFHKWIGRGPTGRARRRGALDAWVRDLFEASGRTYGSPRIHADLLEAGETVSVNTVADSMRRQGFGGPQTQAAPRIDPPRLHRAEVPRPAAPGLHRPGAQREVVRGHHRDPHRRRQALFRFGAGSAFASAAG